MRGTGFAHFSLAGRTAIRDNPALSQSGGARANVKDRAARGTRGKQKRSGVVADPKAKGTPD